MRMTIKVGKKYYYDIGLRGNYNNTDKITRSFGEDHPKFLEDFIEFYGKHKIRIISYGSMLKKRDFIDKMLI